MRACGDCMRADDMPDACDRRRPSLSGEVSDATMGVGLGASAAVGLEIIGDAEHSPAAGTITPSSTSSAWPRAAAKDAAEAGAGAIAAGVIAGVIAGAAEGARLNC